MGLDAMVVTENGRDAAEYGPWNPGIRSELPSRLVPFSTIFRPEHSYTSIAQAAELRDLTGLALEDLATFRPERLVAHELLIRVTANISVPDPEAARIDELGINFRRIAHTIFSGYIQPRLPEIVSLYASLKQTLSAVTDAELNAVMQLRAPFAAPHRTHRGLLDFFGLPRRRERKPATNAESWEDEERGLREWRAGLDASRDPERTAAGRALARVISAVRAKNGGWWGERALLAQIAVGLACNDYGSWALGQFIEPHINEACKREGYRLLSPQERPIIIDPAPNVPSLMSRVRSPYAPAWGGLQRLLG